MKIGIISDVHDHTENLRNALKQLQDTEALICCGDLCSPFIVDILGEGYTMGDIHLVFGNNDGDLFRITKKAGGYSHMKLHGEFCETELAGRHFAINHFDNIGRALARAGLYDVVCYGHNHQFEVRREGETLVINPGEIMGVLSGQATFVVYDSEKHAAAKFSL